MKDVGWAIRKDLPGVSYEEAIERVEKALGERGFGILTEIDVKSTLKKKLGEEFKKYVILGACNPELAHRALGTDDNVGLLLPCNVVVAETEGGSEAAYVRPHAMLSVADNPDLAPVADDAEDRLREAFEAL